MERPLYKVEIDEEDAVTGVNLVSFVTNPAMEAGWISLSSQNPVEVKLNSNSKKQILTGALIIPNKRILRIDASGEEYDIMFDEQSIWQINKKLHKNKLTDQTNIEHFIPVEGNYMVESWIVEDPKNDKSNALGLGEYPKGTLMMSIHIPDKNLFEEVSKQMTGFSLEGIFHHVKTNNTNNKFKMNKDFLSKLKEDFLSIFSKYDNVEEVAQEEVKPEVELSIVEQPVVETSTDVLPTDTPTEQTPTMEDTPVEDVKPENEVVTMVGELKQMIEEMKNQLNDLTNQNQTLSKEKTELEAKVEELSKQPATSKVEAIPTQLSTATLKKGQEAYNKLMALSVQNPNILK